MKLHLYIRDHEAYLEGSFNHCFSVIADKATWDRLFPEYTYAGEFEFTPEVSTDDVTLAAIENIDTEINQTRAKLQSQVNGLETRKQNLLAITHQP